MFSDYAKVSTIIFGMMIIALGSGIMGIYIPIRLGADGVEIATIGYVVTAYAVGMLLGCIWGGLAIRRVGHIRAFAVYTTTAAITILIMSMTDDPWHWMALRVLHGFCANGIFLIAQSWLNEITPSHMRGRIMSVFFLTYTVSLGGGALIVGQVDVGTGIVFSIAAILYALATIPIALTHTPPPAVPEKIQVALWEVFRVSPVGFIGAFVSGGLGMTLQSVGAIYAGLLGLAAFEISRLMATTQTGNLVFQWPLGMLSDKIDRRVVMVLIGILALVSTILISQGSVLGLIGLTISMAAFAGLTESLFSISTAQVNDRAQEGDYVKVSSTILVVWSLGATVGPLAATQAMDLFGADGLVYYFAVILIPFIAFSITRIRSREDAPKEDQEDFQVMPSVPIHAEMAPYTPEEELEEWLNSGDDTPDLAPENQEKA